MVGLKDVAAAAGVSIRTASRAIRQDGYVHPQTRAAVMSAVYALDYQPNRVAQSLRTGKSYEISVVIGTLDELHIRKVAGFEETFRAAGFVVNLLFPPPPVMPVTLSESTGYKCDLGVDASEVFADLISRRPAGVAIFPLPAELTTLLTDSLQIAKIPAVQIDGRLDSVRASDCDDSGCVVSPIANVAIDRQQGVYDAVHFLVRRGAERIAFCGSTTDPSRHDGYARALAELGREPIIFARETRTGGQFSDGRAAAAVFAGLLPRPDAVVLYTDIMAMGFLAGLSGSGIRVPEDVRVVGFDDRDAAAYANPPLTTVAQPNQTVGVAAAEILLGQIRGEDAPGGGWSRTIATALVVREST